MTAVTWGSVWPGAALRTGCDGAGRPGTESQIIVEILVVEPLLGYDTAGIRDRHLHRFFAVELTRVFDRDSDGIERSRLSTSEVNMVFRLRCAVDRAPSRKAIPTTKHIEKPTLKQYKKLE